MNRLLGKILLFPKTVLFIILIVSLVFFVIMRKNSRMETDLDEYMPKNHPALILSDEAEKMFYIKDEIIIAIENKEGIYN